MISLNASNIVEKINDMERKSYRIDRSYARGISPYGSSTGFTFFQSHALQKYVQPFRFLYARCAGTLLVSHKIKTAYAV